MHKHTTILPGRDLLVIAIPDSPLPVFFSKETRPAYVPDTVKAIFPAHLITAGGHYHQAIVDFGTDLGRMFAEIAEAYASVLEKEAHELAMLDEMPDYAEVMF